MSKRMLLLIGAVLILVGCGEQYPYVYKIVKAIRHGTGSPQVVAYDGTVCPAEFPSYTAGAVEGQEFGCRWEPLREDR